jgi:hypothetical protein
MRYVDFKDARAYVEDLKDFTSLELNLILWGISDFSSPQN